MSRQSGSAKSSCGRPVWRGSRGRSRRGSRAAPCVAGDRGELGDERGRVFRAGGVVGGDEDDGADAAGSGGRGRRPGRGACPAPQGSGTASMPFMSSHILWLKYQGTGSITASPGAARVVISGAEGLVAAGGDRDLVGADVAAVGGAPAPGDLGAQRGDGRGPGRRGGCRRSARTISAIASRRGSGGGSTGAAWLRLISGRSGGEVDALRASAGPPSPAAGRCGGSSGLIGVMARSSLGPRA